MRPPTSREGAQADQGVRPLTRRNTETGALYERLPKVVAQIRRALALEESLLVAALRHGYESPDHIKDEVLCYLIREQLRAGRQETANAIAEILLRRHAGTIRKRIDRRGIEERHREDCTGEIMSQLLIELFDTDSDKSEFAQVRFGLYFEKLSNGVIGRFRKLQRQERQTESVAVFTRGERAEEIDLLDTLADEHALSAEDRVITKDALAQLPDELRGPFTLRHLDGWPTESDSPTGLSISRQLNVTPRTVRNRLRDAEARLRRWREGK